jgi:tRNA(fMet)-specific endonuclease VapC
MSSYLLDTGIVIRHLRGQRRFVQMLRGFGALGRLSVAAVTRLEVHAGMSPEEKYATQKLLSRFVTCDMDRDIADRAGDYIRESGLRGSVLSVPDAIIAATAIKHGLTLVTLNRGDFEGISGLSLASIPETA